MDAVTYPDQSVSDFISNRLVAFRVPPENKSLGEKFDVKWTPTLVTLGSDGKEYHRTVGFLDPGQLVASLLLGEGKYFFNNDKFPEALEVLEKIITEHAGSDATPEAIFLRGVSQYKNSSNPLFLKDAYELLHRDFQNNEWTKRAYPYRLIG